jgi:predicted enzyme related to lactoylglutathione lyase
MTIKTSYQPGEPCWADLATPDMDSTIAFYGGLFGWEADESRGEEFGGYRRFLKDGKAVAGVMPLMSPEQPAVWSCHVAVDDADKIAALVTEAGGMTYAPPMDVAELGRMAVFADPTGAAFGVWQAGTFIGAELIETEGTLQWIELATRDQKTALPFYSNLFGWQTHVSPGYTEFQLGGTSVAGCMDMPEMVPAQVPNYWMPYFNAGDPQAQAHKAASLGGTIVVPATTMAQVTFAVVQDPHGTTFGLLRLNV